MVIFPMGIPKNLIWLASSMLPITSQGLKPYDVAKKGGRYAVMALLKESLGTTLDDLWSQDPRLDEDQWIILPNAAIHWA